MPRWNFEITPLRSRHLFSSRETGAARCLLPRWCTERSGCRRDLLGAGDFDEAGPVFVRTPTAPISTPIYFPNFPE
jgi:hypothetical protein